MVLQATDEKKNLLMQKAKITWLQVGDGNNSYFHAIVKGRNKENIIHRIMDINGDTMTDFKEMEREVWRYYGDLDGKATRELLHVDIEALRNGPQLHEKYYHDLTQPITKIEVWKTLMSIGDTKASGIDDFNAKIFKATWRIAKYDIMKAVKDFFENNRIYVVVNYALVTLF
ncbi:uncharacterized protein LOC127102067 [Lathyrus oleraceus]|nr:uncharacterized protein LOC127102067 [Pisum sativum]